MNPAIFGTNLGNGAGVLGLATLTSLASFGVFGVVGSSLATAVIPVANTGGIGVVGSSPTGGGVAGFTVGVTNHNHGVEGLQGSANGEGAGVFGHTDSARAVGVQGENTAVNGLAGRFVGNVAIFGTVGASGKQFRIDHPLDPANKYLSHSSIEGPDMMNVYNGNITTDINGSAVVVLPDYFEALNRDFKYQLTVIGEFAQAIVEREIEGNRFAITTDRPNIKVSWQVTGVRRDAYAEAHRILVEEEKSDTERGRYLHPELYETTSTEPDARLPIGWIASMLSGESVDWPDATDSLIG